MELHEISLKETFDLLIDSIINNKERPVFYYVFAMYSLF